MKSRYDFRAKECLAIIIRDTVKWFEENGNGCKAVIGISGGKDSTIAAGIMVKALGKDRVIGVSMPDEGQSTNDAEKICEHFGIEYINFPIGEITGIYRRNVMSEQAVQNLAPRIRMTTLFSIAQSNNGRVINTCNLSEDYIGYSTLFGDDAGSFSPLKNLTVSEIRKIGILLNIPTEWVYKIPDDGLAFSLPDEKKFGFSYDVLDTYIRTGVDPIGFEGISVKEKIDKMHENSEFKRNIMHIPSAFSNSNENIHILYRFD